MTSDDRIADDEPQPSRGQPGHFPREATGGTPVAADRLDRTEHVVAHLAGVYLLGAATLPVGAALLLTAGFGGVIAAGAALLAALGGAGALIFAVGTATRNVSPATATPGRRAGWAVAVTLGGAAGLIGGVHVTVRLDMEYGEAAPWVLAAGLPYLLVAALFLGPRIRVGALAVVVALVAGGGLAVRQENRRDAAEAGRTRVLAMLRAPVELIWTTRIPGYRRMVAPTGTTTAYQPADPATVAYWGEKDITVTVSRAPVRMPDCGPEPLYTPPPPPDRQETPTRELRPEEITCAVRGASLHYRHGAGSHEYVRTVDGTVVRAAAGTVVDAGLLEIAVLTARPMTLEELDHEIFES